MTAAEDPETIRAAELSRWEQMAAGWTARREEMRAMGMPVSEWMVDAIAPRSGQRVLELAAGVGDTGMIAAERILPGGVLVSSDAAEAMLDAARARARELGVENVEFVRLELEWIDLPTASVDAILCRWGLMLVVDPAAAASEMRRVLRPAGRLALAVWDAPERNPWVTTATRALVDLGLHAPGAAGPIGPFALAEPGRLGGLLEAAGFTEVEVRALEFAAAFASVDAYLEERRDVSPLFGEAFARLDEAGREAVRARVAELAAPFAGAGGGLRLPARSWVASATG